MDVAYAKRLLKICDMATGLPESDRASFLEAVCDDDVQLREDLQRLFQSLDEVGNFLERGPLGKSDSGAD